MTVEVKTVQLSVRIDEKIDAAIREVSEESRTPLKQTVEILLRRGLGLADVDESPEARVARAVASGNGRRA